MTGAELAGRLEKLAESWTAASAACLRISDADAGHTNGFVAQGEANALRDCAQDLLAALRAERPEPAAGDVEAVAGFLFAIDRDELCSIEDCRRLATRLLDALRPTDPGPGVEALEALAGRWEASALNREQYEPTPCWELRGCAQDLRAALAALPPPAAGDARAEVELAAREKMREFINAMADEYAHKHFIYDPTTGVWEAGDGAKESYELGLRDAAGAIARLNCEKFGHDWRRWNDITRRCNRCEAQEHGEHLRTALAQGQTGDGP